MSYLGDPCIIRYGMPFKLRHVNTGQFLHSHKIKYVNGSKLQEVTCCEGTNEDGWWLVKGPSGGDSRFNHPIGLPVLNYSIIRLEHMNTDKDLYSHGKFESPSSHQIEVACSDTIYEGKNANWRLEVLNGLEGIPWRIDQLFRLVHVETDNTLHSHSGFHTNSDLQEVTCCLLRDENDLWQVSS